MAFDKTKLGIIFFGMIIGGVLGVAGSYRYYTPIVLEYTSTISDQSSELSVLVTNVDSQTMRYDQLESDYNSLSDQHQIQTNNYESLQSEYSVLMNNYESISEQYYELTDDYLELESNYNTLDCARAPEMSSNCVRS